MSSDACWHRVLRKCRHEAFQRWLPACCHVHRRHRLGCALGWQSRVGTPGSLLLGLKRSTRALLCRLALLLLPCPPLRTLLLRRQGVLFLLLLLLLPPRLS